MTNKTVSSVIDDINEWENPRGGSVFNREDLAWAAGLFEGEGCFTLSGRGTARAILNMTDEDVVRRFAQIVRVGGIRGKRVIRPQHKPQWEWTVQNHEGVQALIAVLWPWLGQRRRSRAVEVLRLTHARPGPNRNKLRCKRGHPFDETNTRYSVQGRACIQCEKQRNRLRPSRAKTTAA